MGAISWQQILENAEVTIENSPKMAEGIKLT